MKNFWVRAASAVVYVALFLGCIYSGDLTGNKLLGGVILAAFLLFVACGCTFEFFRIVKQQGATPSQPLGYAFTVIAASGLDDPSAFATGIKFALVTTVLGLVVAIPHVIAFNYLNARMEQEQDEVENQVLLHLGKTLQERDAKRTESRNG